MKPKSATLKGTPDSFGDHWSLAHRYFSDTRGFGKVYANQG